ncbi:hypothetical protein LTR91_025617 [Friedmanniomyces endolithicus]|uniref:BTB domain-containing protein n=1 Tax=Friedmanniomyces endolithicus TaxID=329885 RepID=A0AAN6F6X0_9PEZI|nr:hypothetical protein LTR82_018022 [Friedmanniomyces endolithicus]KAK0950505.1 hypothetical protein LTR91_025617 [Friedmanniomyces endolithicus]KAK0950992.1 hypothetical protein LTS01_025415 [Friedmanniomyces endolithicus]KAK1021117.1 hypothetical protein LTS16_026726 [Friedmanniomyces endolithicus]
METKIVEVDIVDPDTLHRALTYLYTGTYGADVPTSNAVALDSEHNSILEASGVDVLTGTNDNAQNHSDESDLDSADAAIPSAHSQAQPTLPDTEVTVQEESPVVADGGDDFKSNDNCDHAIEERKSGRSSANLRVHTLVYILADYYQVPDLRRLAVNKFAAALDMEDEEGLGDICHLVYRVAPSTACDLRSCLSNAIAVNGRTLNKDKTFMDAVLDLPELLRDCFSDLVGHYQTAFAERDAAISASLKAEDESKDANVKGQVEKERVIAQVNQARRCRHCALENNGWYPPELSQLNVPVEPSEKVVVIDPGIVLGANISYNTPGEVEYVYTMPWTVAVRFPLLTA